MADARADTRVVAHGALRARSLYSPLRQPRIPGRAEVEKIGLWLRWRRWIGRRLLCGVGA
jgi:hypothetical protein